MPELCLILALSEFRCNLAGLLGPRKYDTHDAGIFRFFDLTNLLFFFELDYYTSMFLFKILQGCTRSVFLELFAAVWCFDLFPGGILR